MKKDVKELKEKFSDSISKVVRSFPSKEDRLKVLKTFILPVHV